MRFAVLRDYIHNLVITGGSILIIGGDCDNGASRDWVVVVALRVTRSDFWTFLQRLVKSTQ
jgi:hypothetical protein